VRAVNQLGLNGHDPHSLFWILHFGSPIGEERYQKVDITITDMDEELSARRGFEML
jgi:hypothetical protein